MEMNVTIQSVLYDEIWGFFLFLGNVTSNIYCIQYYFWPFHLIICDKEINVLLRSLLHNEK